MGSSNSSSKADATEVMDLIKENKVMVFSKSYCPHCTRAKSLLKNGGIQHKVVELDQRGNGSQMQNYLEATSGQRTVPNIFIAEKHLGGNSEL